MRSPPPKPQHSFLALGADDLHMSEPAIEYLDCMLGTLTLVVLETGHASGLEKSGNVQSDLKVPRAEAFTGGRQFRGFR